jgi:Flp pilus assembly pilin Flp
MFEFIKSCVARTKETEGQGLVEYALVVILGAIACIAMLTTLGQAVAFTF